MISMYREICSQSNKSVLDRWSPSGRGSAPSTHKTVHNCLWLQFLRIPCPLLPLPRGCSVESISHWNIFTWGNGEILSEHPFPRKLVVTPSGMEMASQSIPMGDFLLFFPVIIELFHRPTNFQKHHKIHVSKLKPFISPSYTLGSQFTGTCC